MRSAVPLLLLGLFACLASVFALGCRPSVTCGAGTHLARDTCVPDTLAADGGLEDAAAHDGSPDDGLLSDGSARDATTTRDGGEPGDLQDGDPCPIDASGNSTLSPSCVGDSLRYCSGDYVRITDCTELGDRCLPGATASDLPRCDGGVYTACHVSTTSTTCADSSHALLCAGGYPNAAGFTYTIACATFGPGYTCLMSTTEGGCYPPGTVPCDAASAGSHCSADGASIVTCNDGLEYTVPCDSRTPGSVCDLGPGDEPVCILPGAMRCEPGTIVSRCISDTVIEECDYTTAHVGTFSCNRGTRCRVSELGFAECVPDTAMSCDPATATARCVDHDQLARCDTRGFEEFLDCTTVGIGYRCVPDSPARCDMVTDCDPSTFVPTCDGEVAQNCEPGGWISEQACDPFVPCRVVDGDAGCAS